MSAAEVITAYETGGTPVPTEEVLESEALNLRVGEIVEVRTEAEILATLDERAELESLPFMPEMLHFCGHRFRVDKLAVKLCDTIGYTGIYRMRNAVHLEGLRCDGQAHGGCQAGCLLYWKEAWLKRVPPDGHPADPAPEPGPPSRTRATLMAATRQKGAAPDDERFSCQATELLRAAPTRIPPWHVGQYVLDVRSGNATLLATIRAVAIGAFNEYQDFSRRFLPRPLRIRTPRWACSRASWSGSKASRRSSTRSTPTTATVGCRSTPTCCGTPAARPGCCDGSSGSSTSARASCYGSSARASSWMA
jgi:hypothetical protein